MDAALQRVVEGEVVHRHRSLALVHVLVQAVGVAVPVLGHRVRGARSPDIVPLEVRRVALDEVEAQCPEPDLLHHVFDVRVDVLAHLGVRVVYTRGVLRGLACDAGPGSTRHGGAVVADSPTPPSRILELQPSPGGVLLRGASVVDHHIQHRHNLLLMHRGNQPLQGLSTSVFVVQNVPLSGQVRVIVDGVRRRREPHHVYTRRSKLGQQTEEDSVPAVRLARAPIEGLEHDDAPLLPDPRRIQKRYHTNIDRIRLWRDNVRQDVVQEP
mmetsp:Transcript_125872/g.364204  ORF Transcript_125872/g.364204 Transcript_125872/m.364204 type:complete len:269 (-) Transcript_125872:711-1517(-)